MSLRDFIFAEERVKVLNKESGTSTFNQVYDKLKAKQDKNMTTKTLYLDKHKLHGLINQCHIITIISISIKKYSKLCTDKIPLLLTNFILIIPCIFLTG